MKEKREDATKNRRRTRVEDLPKQKRELSKEEQKKVKGGARGLAVGRGIRVRST